jgi:hypothetical protein
MYNPDESVATPMGLERDMLLVPPLFAVLVIKLFD